MKKLLLFIGIALCLASCSLSLSAQWKYTDIYLMVDKDTTLFQSTFLVDEFTPEFEIVVKKCSSSERKESYYTMTDVGKTSYKWGGLKSQRIVYKVATVKKENADVITEFRYPTFTSPWTIRWDIVASWILLVVFGMLIIKKQKTTHQKTKIIVGIIVGIVSIFMTLGVVSNFDIHLNFIICVVGLTLLLLLFFLGVTFKIVFGPYSVVFIAYISFSMGWLIGMGINTGQWLPTVVGIVCLIIGMLCRLISKKLDSPTK